MKLKNFKFINKLLIVIALLVIENTAFAQAPTINSFTPDSGSIGTLVTIVGTNLNNLNTIKIGGVSAIKISATSTNLKAMVMPGAITGNIYLKNSSGNVTSGSSFTKIASIPPALQQGNKLVGTGNLGSAYQGGAVSISADGNTAIVGGSSDNSAQGAAWVFVRIGSVWSQQVSKLVGTGNIGAANQGQSVSISADGNTAIIGGAGDSLNKGAAWIFIRNGVVWNQQGNKLVGTGNIGAAQQGVSVSISADGNTAIVGGFTDNTSQGAAWVFTRSGGIWSQQGNKLVGTGSIGTFVNQGASVSISADGNTAIVGGHGDNYDQGAAWVYNRNGGVWSQQGNKLVGTGATGNSRQGTSVSLSADGNTAMVGGIFDNSNIGATWAYTRTGTVWSQQGNKLVGIGNSGGSRQGCSLSLTADGNMVIIGGFGDNTSKGATWVFTRNGSVWNQQGNKRVGTGSIGVYIYQGSSVSISSDGNTVIAGVSGDNSNQGAAWIFNGPASSNANLSNIVLSSGTLSPVFASDTIVYASTTTAPTITVTPTKVETNSTIQVRVNSGVYATVNSGSPSSSIALNLGTNTIDVKVTAQDGTTIKIYSITITKVPLPVKLLNFNGVKIENDVLLNWQTASEINNSHFEIERSINGKDFETIGRVAGIHNSNLLTSYKFIDKDIILSKEPIYYYRLKQVDFDGKFEYFEPIRIIIEEIDVLKITINPNPFTNEVTISFESTTKEVTKLIIIDAIGREVFSKNIQSNIGNNHINIDEIAHLKSGIYFARFANNNGLSQSFKLVKN